jgi:hypothetical protein
MLYCIGNKEIIMKLADFDLLETEIPKGVQAVLDFGKYELSIVQHSFSYGGTQGLYEIAVFEDARQVELPGITAEGDTVKGFLTEKEIDAIIKKMFTITQQEPVQI